MSILDGDPERLRLVCPHYRLPGRSIAEKWEHSLAMGFDGVEVSGPAAAVREDLPRLIALRRRGAVFPTVNSGGPPFIGDPDPGRRAAAVSNLKALLSLTAELGGVGATTPACFGLRSRAIPALRPPADYAPERQALVETVAELGQHAESEGVVLLLEPLNRYEDHHLNRLDQAVEVIKDAGTPAVKVLADVFHLNIEEADLGAALRQAGSYVYHVQLADSNRLEPGAGHLDFQPIFKSLREEGFARYYALECSLSGPPEIVLPRTVGHLRDVWRSTFASVQTSP
jgi:sugar phosphate isomerase/epimerase